MKSFSFFQESLPELPDWMQILFSADDVGGIEIRNHFFDLYIRRIEVWLNGRRAEWRFPQDGQSLPFLWRMGAPLRLSIGEPVSRQQNIHVMVSTDEAGTLFFSSQPAWPETPVSHYKQSLLDVFQREYTVDVIVDSRQVVGKRSELKLGFALFPFEKTEDASDWFDPVAGEMKPAVLRMVKDLSPQLLGARVHESDKPERLIAFARACAGLEAEPYFKFQQIDRVSIWVLEAIELFSQLAAEKSWWQPLVYLDFSWPEALSAEDCIACDRLLAQLRERGIRCKVIGRAEQPDTAERPADSAEDADFAGISWVSPGTAGWITGNANAQRELASALPVKFERAIRANAVGVGELRSSKPLAVAPLSYFRSPDLPAEKYRMNPSKIDAFYYAGVINAILRNSGKVALALLGPLMGEGGIIQSSEKTFFPSALFSLLQLYQDTQEFVLGTPVSFQKQIPMMDWSGIPAVVEAQTIPMTDVFASRSASADKLFLLVMNRHPRKRALVKVSFCGFDPMRPLRAKVLRSSGRATQNSAGHPENVRCGIVNMPKYKMMDHVNLDIPAAGIASMLLETKQS